jgi:hypothetical protein
MRSIQISKPPVAQTSMSYGKTEADYTPWHYSVTLTTKSGLPDWVAIRANPNLLTLNDILWLSLSTILEAHMQPDQEFAKSTSPERVYV